MLKDGTRVSFINEADNFRRFIKFHLNDSLIRLGYKLIDNIHIEAIVDYIVMANDDGCYTTDEWVMDTVSNYPGEYLEKEIDD